MSPATARPLIIAHRGASGHAPEHTFAAWDLALEMGADYLEQDLQMTRDGVLVVLHDATLDRTARGHACRGHVRDRTYEEIRDCNVGEWFNHAFPERARPEFAQQTIPTLDAVFARYRDRARFYIETKEPEESPGMETTLVRLLDAHNLMPATARDDRVILQSFSSRSLQLLHSLEPRFFLVKLLHRLQGPFLFRQLRHIATYARAIGPDYRLVSRKLIDAAHEHGLAVHPWTVNGEAEMIRLIELGVDGMFTDYPDRLRHVRDRVRRTHSVRPP